MQNFYDVRIEYYDKRRLHLLGKLTDEWDKLDNKVSFIYLDKTSVFNKN